MAFHGRPYHIIALVEHRKPFLKIPRSVEVGGGHERLNDLNNDMTLQLVYDEYCRVNAGQKIYSYSSFCRHYADKKPNWEPQELFTNLHYVAGDVMEIDFAGDDLIWVDEYAEVHRDRVFVAALAREKRECFFFCVFVKFCMDGLRCSMPLGS